MTLEITTVVTLDRKEKISMDRWRLNLLMFLKKETRFIGILFVRAGEGLFFSKGGNKLFGVFIRLSRRATIRRGMSTRKAWTSSTFPSTR